MSKFIGAASISRGDLLKGKEHAMRRLILNFLNFTRFNTAFGYQEINKLLQQHNIESTDDSIVAFVQSIKGEKIAFMVFEIAPDEYSFYLVSGSEEELLRMTKMEHNHAGTNGNPNPSS